MDSTLPRSNLVPTTFISHRLSELQTPLLLGGRIVTMQLSPPASVKLILTSIVDSLADNLPLASIGGEPHC